MLIIYFKKKNHTMQFSGFLFLIPSLTVEEYLW